MYYKVSVAFICKATINEYEDLISQMMLIMVL